VRSIRKYYFKNIKINIDYKNIINYTLSSLNEKYNAEIIIEAKWITKDIIEVYNPEQHWNPQLFIENSLQEPKEKIKHKLIEKCYNITYFIFFVVVKFLIYYN
jgi:hypothetical protein